MLNVITLFSGYDSQALAGNSIVVACLYYIFKNIFVQTEPEAGTQTKLF